MFTHQLHLQMAELSAGLVSVGMRLLCSGTLRGTFQLELRLKKLGTKSLIYKIDISRNAEPIASGMTTVVQCELRDGKLVGIPILDPMRRRFEEYLDLNA